MIDLHVYRLKIDYHSHFQNFYCLKHLLKIRKKRVDWGGFDIQFLTETYLMLNEYRIISLLRDFPSKKNLI